MNPFETYVCYLAIKRHFINKNYDYHKYNGKIKANLKSFYKRKDRFYFEKLSRQKTNEEIINFFVSNFVSSEDSQSLWIGEIIHNGEDNYKSWMKKIQSIVYTFKNEINFLNSKNFDSMFFIENNKHPEILKMYLRKNISLETLVILNSILQFKNRFDKKLFDPVWESISTKISKYAPFLHIDIDRFKTILKECIL
jgi:hypothetical protein